MKLKKAGNKSKFEWKKLQSGKKREKPQSFGFNGNPQKKGLPRAEKFVEEHKEHRKEIRKPR